MTLFCPVSFVSAMRIAKQNFQTQDSGGQQAKMELLALPSQNQSIWGTRKQFSCSIYLLMFPVCTIYPLCGSFLEGKDCLHPYHLQDRKTVGLLGSQDCSGQAGIFSDWQIRRKKLDIQRCIYICIYKDILKQKKFFFLKALGQKQDFTLGLTFVCPGRDSF